jgi:hypothetical protein
MPVGLYIELTNSILSMHISIAIISINYWHFVTKLIIFENNETKDFISKNASITTTSIDPSNAFLDGGSLSVYKDKNPLSFPHSPGHNFVQFLQYGNGQEPSNIYNPADDGEWLQPIIADAIPAEMSNK